MITIIRKEEFCKRDTNLKTADEEETPREREKRGERGKKKRKNTERSRKKNNFHLSLVMM
jgi:hypothetical protein